MAIIPLGKLQAWQLALGAFSADGVEFGGQTVEGSLFFNGYFESPVRRSFSDLKVNWTANAGMKDYAADELRSVPERVNDFETIGF